MRQKQSQKIEAINKVIRDYFTVNTSVEKVSSKDLMPLFIKKGIFNSDHRNGLPIRKVLRELDARNQLHLIPYLFPERKQKNTNWFFVNPHTSAPNPISSTRAVEIHRKNTEKTHGSSPRTLSDESYVIDLCDCVLKTKASRGRRFGFLIGDPDKNGNCRKLPVDAYYSSLSLVVEYCERQHTESVKHLINRMF